MKDMTTEVFATLSIIILSWVVLLAADAALCGILNLIAGISFRKAFLWGCISLIIPPAVIAYGGLVERKMLKVNQVEVEFDGLPENFEGYRIVHISDIHARSFQGRETDLLKAVETINVLNPDMVAFSGDLITMLPDELDGIGGILSGIKSSDGVFSVLGNHDYCMYSDMSSEDKEAALEKLITIQGEMGWTLLMNENRIIRRGEDSIAVVGVENTSTSRHFPSRGYLKRASEGTEGMFRILLSHNPLHWESEVLDHGFPLTLSGHTHAMQFSLFGWSPSRYLFPQYRGLYQSYCQIHEAHQRGSEQEDSDRCCSEQNESGILCPGRQFLRRRIHGRCEDSNQYLYVNTGIGETIFPVRIGVRPEITLIILKSSRHR